MPEMRPKPREGTDRFSESINITSKRYREFFELLRTRSEEETDAKSGWAQLKHAKKSIPVQNGLSYLRDSIQPVLAMNRGVKQTMEQITKAKQLLLRNTFSTPEDLSKFYKLLRDKEGVMFGDVVSQTVTDIYNTQDPKTHSLLTQLIYVQGLSRALFPEIPEPRTVLEAALQQSKTFLSEGKSLKLVLPKEPKNVRLARMLKEDFELLATMQIINDYYLDGLNQSRKGKRMGTSWDMPYGPIDTFIVGKMGKKTNAFLDIPALGAMQEYIDEVRSTEEGEKLIEPYRDIQLFAEYVKLWTSFNSLRNSASQIYFDEANLKNIRELPAVDWGSIHFSKAAPSCQRVFFEGNKDPLFVSVDPAPGKAYVATVSITSTHHFLEVESRAGGTQAARDMVNPLKKPFKDSAYMDSPGFAYYVDKSTGELRLYGDSNYLARAQLGKDYEDCKRLVHFALYNLTHSDYVEGDETSKSPNDVKVLQPVPLPVNEIPDAPSKRKIEHSQNGGTVEGRAFLGRGAHTRLLPAGWYPGFDAWTNARDASETIELYAVVLNDSLKEPLEERKLELGADYKEFRNALQKMHKELGSQVRFETYVSESVVEDE